MKSGNYENWTVSTNCRKFWTSKLVNPRCFHLQFASLRLNNRMKCCCIPRIVSGIFVFLFINDQMSNFHLWCETRNMFLMNIGKRQNKGPCFLLCFSINYRDFLVKLKPIISLFQTMKIIRLLDFLCLGLPFSPLFYELSAKSHAQKV